MGDYMAITCLNMNTNDRNTKGTVPSVSLGLWEILHNANFNPLEFEGFRKEAGLNAFTLSASRWIEATNAIGLVSQSGRNGGTYAITDIAFKFANWVSVEFELYLVMEFQRLKAKEQELLGWTAKRELSKINYRIHTDAIKSNLICLSNMENVFDKRVQSQIYLSFAERRKGRTKFNINAVLINDGLPQGERLVKLNQIAIRQMKVLNDNEGRKLLK